MIQRSIIRPGLIGLQTIIIGVPTIGLPAVISLRFSMITTFNNSKDFYTGSQSVLQYTEYSNWVLDTIIIPSPHALTRTRVTVDRACSNFLVFHPSLFPFLSFVLPLLAGSPSPLHSHPLTSPNPSLSSLYISHSPSWYLPPNPCHTHLPHPPAVSASVRFTISQSPCSTLMVFTLATIAARSWGLTSTATGMNRPPGPIQPLQPPNTSSYSTTKTLWVVVLQPIIGLKWGFLSWFRHEKGVVL